MAEIVKNNPANDPDSKPVKGYSKFRPNRSLYQTMAFGLNTPHFAMEVVEGDKNVSVRVASEVDTQSLKAPVMSPVKMHKDYFFAPLRAILPNSADLLITNPLSGDDVDASEVNALLSRTSLYNWLNGAVSDVNNALTKAQLGGVTIDSTAAALAQSDAYLLSALVKIIQKIELFTSSASLLSVLGHSIQRAVYWGVTERNVYLSTDKVVDLISQRIKSQLTQFTFKTKTLSQTGTTTPAFSAAEDITITVYPNADIRDCYGTAWNFEQFLDYVRQGNYVYQIITNSEDVAPDAALYEGAWGLKYKFGEPIAVIEEGEDDEGNPTSVVTYEDNTKFVNGVLRLSSSDTTTINISRLVAYQLACAQFYTDDAVDYVYSTRLWHQNQDCLAQICLGTVSGGLSSTFYFPYNGLQQRYDSVSRHILSAVLARYSLTAANNSASVSGNAVTLTVGSTTASVQTQAIAQLGYLVNLFGFTRSLKYRDYFVGSRPHPLAVGDVSVTVASSQFSVVDVTKNIQVQRFLNQVNRVGRRFKEYIQGIFGVTPMPDPHEIVFLGHTSDVIGGEETENTGAAQLTDAQTVTSKFRTQSSRFAFEGSFAEPGILIGITNFDIVRPYTEATDRALLHVDRYDMFNPFLQQIGDQDVALIELDATKAADTAFGYKLRYSEYKQAVDRAVGGFVEYLPGYAFVNQPGLYVRRSGLNISPDFIRSNPAEFDQFFLALTNYSLAGRFHFIIRQDISVDASRPMEAAPSIL